MTTPPVPVTNAKSNVNSIDEESVIEVGNSPQSSKYAYVTLISGIDKRFKYLYCYSDDDYTNVKEFNHALTGEPYRIYKSSFKGIFKLKDKLNPVNIWKHSQVISQTSPQPICS